MVLVKPINAELILLWNCYIKKICYTIPYKSHFQSRNNKYFIHFSITLK